VTIEEIKMVLKDPVKYFGYNGPEKLVPQSEEALIKQEIMDLAATDHKSSQ
jgi:hypothetical protein